MVSAKDPFTIKIADPKDKKKKKRRRTENDEEDDTIQGINLQMKARCILNPFSCRL